MLARLAALSLLACMTVFGLVGAPALAANNEQEIAQLRLYIQQLEERVRQLTGENERLTHQLQQVGVGAAAAPQANGAVPTGAVAGAGPVLQAPAVGAAPSALSPGADDGSIAQDDPRVAPDGATADTGPVDLSTLAAQSDPGFSDTAGGDPLGSPAAGPKNGGAANTQTAGLPARAPVQPPMTGNAREEYDAAYGYILTGDYGAAEGRFKTWLAAFPKDPQVPDAQFWLGESYFQEGKAREAATTFLNLHNSAPQSPRAADVLVRLGMSLAKLGEKDAACATLVEVGKRYPGAAKPVQQRVAEELKRNAC